MRIDWLFVAGMIVALIIGFYIFDTMISEIRAYKDEHGEYPDISGPDFAIIIFHFMFLAGWIITMCIIFLINGDSK